MIGGTLLVTSGKGPLRLVFRALRGPTIDYLTSMPHFETETQILILTRPDARTERQSLSVFLPSGRVP